MKVGPFTIHDSHEHPVRVDDDRRHHRGVEQHRGRADRRAGRQRDARLPSWSGSGSARPTGVGFPGEAAGVLLPGDRWDEVIRATVSYGAGHLRHPAADGQRLRHDRERGPMDAADARARVRGTRRRRSARPRRRRTRRIIRPDTAQLLTSMLASAVEEGTGVNAQIPGYQVAGKTGTSRKLDAYGHYVHRYDASFAGFLPAADPRVVIARLDRRAPNRLRRPRGGAAVPGDRPVRDPAARRSSAAPPVALPPHASGTS